MKMLLKLLFTVAICLPAAPAFAQQSSARVLSTCGNIVYPAGSTSLVTQDVNGRACGPASGTPGNPTVVAPTNALSSDASGSVTTGGTYQTALVQNLTRKNCTIQNNDASKVEPLFVSIASSPTVANSYALQYGDSFSCTSGNVVMGDAIKVSAATTGHTFVETSQ